MNKWVTIITTGIIIIAIILILPVCLNKGKDSNTISSIDVNIGDSLALNYHIHLQTNDGRITIEKQYLYSIVEKKEETWNEKKVNGFINEIIKCGILQWNENYDNEEWSDGILWNIKIEFDNGAEKYSRGACGFPQYKQWKQYIELLSSYFDNDISNYYLISEEDYHMFMN